MDRDEMLAVALHTAVRRLPTMLLLLLAAVGAVCAVTLLVRHVQEVRGEGAVASPAMPSVAYADELSSQSRFTANLDYTSLAAPGDGSVVSQVMWDDDWFRADPMDYNHDLATTSSVLAALAYSESGYYQVSNAQPAYMEHALATLGFDDVSTESYRYRSEIVDEVLNLFTDDADAVAYTIARKHLQPEGGASGDDRPRDLILVSIRGSYGSEWLSNLNLAPAAEDVADDAAESQMSQLREELTKLTHPLSDALHSWISFVGVLAGTGTGAEEDQAQGVRSSDDEGQLALTGEHDHRGYFRASEEICTQLNEWISVSTERGAEVSVLLVGHSRGGAIANLVASEIDDAVAHSASNADASKSALADVAATYAYTFASPATTLSSSAHDARYSNIFNIVNPADIMPYLPLQSWGYERYGVNLYLPSVDSEDFDGKYRDMRRAYAKTVGAESGYDPMDEHAIDGTLARVSQQVASAQDLMTPTGVAATVSSCVTGIDPVRVLYGHYPSTYIAWMDVLDADDLAK